MRLTRKVATGSLPLLRILARCKVLRADFHAAAGASKQAGELIGTIPVMQGGNSKHPHSPLVLS